MVQTTIVNDQPGLLPAAFESYGPRRSTWAVLNSTDQNNNVCGRWITRNTDGTAGAGGSGPDLGILTAIKTYSRDGLTLNDDLSPTLAVKNNAIGCFTSLASGLTVQGLQKAADTATLIGWNVYFKVSTGELQFSDTSPGQGWSEAVNASVVQSAPADSDADALVPVIISLTGLA